MARMRRVMDSMSDSMGIMDRKRVSVTVRVR